MWEAGLFLDRAVDKAEAGETSVVEEEPLALVQSPLFEREPTTSTADLVGSMTWYGARIFLRRSFEKKPRGMQCLLAQSKALE